MATLADLSFDTSSEEEAFEGFTPEDVLRAIERGAEVQQIHEDELSDISFDEEFEEESENNESESSDDEWSDTLAQVDIPQFRETSGPTTPMKADKNELDFLELLFPDEIYGILVTETNRYAQQLQEKLGKDDTNWTDTTRAEMKAFIGIRIFMSVLQLPSMDMYWSKDYMFGNLFIPNIMPRDRFNKLCQYFHANNSTLNPPCGTLGPLRHDRLHHVRKISEIVHGNCLEQYKPHQNTSVDEAMIAFRGRLGFRQYLPAKPTKYGIKVWMRADSENAYCNEFDIYTGKSDDSTDGIGLTSRVVLKLTEKIAGKNHIVNIDNYFTSFNLFKMLMEKQIYARGTARSNRKNFPSNLLHKKCVKNQGEKKVLQRGTITAYAWKDKKVIYFLSSADDPTLDNLQVQRRQKDGTQRLIASPSVVQNYNVKMNGVDKSDQTRTEYPTFRMCKRWWTYVFYFLLDLSIANAFVLMKESPNHVLITKTGRNKTRDMLSFRMNLAKQLTGNFRISRKRKRWSNVDPLDVEHWPIESDKRGRCKHCYSNKIRKDVKIKCCGCDVFLCLDCFRDFHKK